MIDGYRVAEEHLGRDAFEVARQLREAQRSSSVDEWSGDATSASARTAGSPTDCYRPSANWLAAGRRLRRGMPPPSRTESGGRLALALESKGSPANVLDELWPGGRLRAAPLSRRRSRGDYRRRSGGDLPLEAEGPPRRPGAGSQPVLSEVRSQPRDGRHGTARSGNGRAPRDARRCRVRTVCPRPRPRRR